MVFDVRELIMGKIKWDSVTFTSPYPHNQHVNLQGQARDMATEWTKLEVRKPAFVAPDTTSSGLLGQLLSTIWACSLIQTTRAALCRMQGPLSLLALLLHKLVLYLGQKWSMDVKRER